MTVRLGWRQSGSEASTGEAKMSLIVGRPGVARDKGPGAPPDVTVGRRKRRGVNGYGSFPARRFNPSGKNGARQRGSIPRHVTADCPGRRFLGLTAQTAGNRAGGNMRGVEDSGARTTRSASSGPPAAKGAVRRATSEGE